MDPTIIAVILTGIFTVISSSGLWAFLQKRDTTKTATARLLMGLAYDKIMHLGMAYIDRGWISRDEYEEFEKYLFQPYKDFGGNGVAERIMNDVRALPMRSPGKYTEIVHRPHMEDHNERFH